MADFGTTAIGGDRKQNGVLTGDARGAWLTSNREAMQIMDAYMIQAEKAFAERVKAAGLVSTGELLNSFRHIAANEGEKYIEARLEMSATARFKDLQRMNYSRTPPLLAMEEWVERVGVGHFAHVAGYPKGVFPATEAKAIERIAWGLKMSLLKRPNVVRGYRGIYSDPLLKDVLPYLFRDLSTACNLTAIRAFKLTFAS